MAPADESASYSPASLQVASSDSSDTEGIDPRILGVREEEAFILAESKVLEEDPTHFGENIYGLGMASLVRDYVALHLGDPKTSVHRSCRIFCSMTNILVCLFIQIFLLSAIYGLLCKSAVAEIRKDYSEYEAAVYGAENVHKLSTGFLRGNKDFTNLNITAFHALSESTKHSVCQIPLAHPMYLCAILILWTLTCVTDMRTTCSLTYTLMIVTPRVHDIGEVLKLHDEHGHTVEVVGLTRAMKYLLFLSCLLPRFVSILCLTFLGCKWLMATNNLADLLLNAVALEFMLMLKELLFSTMASRRNKWLVEKTLIINVPTHGLHKHGWLSMFGQGACLLTVFIVLFWVYLYVYHFQQVLPEYNWDVRSTCAQWNGAVHMPHLFR